MGDHVIFPRSGTGDTYRCRINICFCATCQCPWCPILEKQHNPPKWLNSLDTNFNILGFTDGLWRGNFIVTFYREVHFLISNKWIKAFNFTIFHSIYKTSFNKRFGKLSNKGGGLETETLERRLNPALCVLQTYFRISL